MFFHRYIIPIALLFSCAFCDEWRNTRLGIKNYKQEDYSEALEKFEKAQKSAPDNPITAYNVGATMYKQERYGDAARQFADAIKNDTISTDTSITADFLYGIGNCAYRADSMSQAAKLYKSSIMIQPFDEDAKYNLELILRKMQNQSDSQSQCQQNQQKQQDKQNQQQQQQNQCDKENQQQQEQEKQQEQEQQQQQQEQQKQQKQQQTGMSKEEAERLMEAMERQEQELLQEYFEKRKGNGSRYRNPRDW